MHRLARPLAAWLALQQLLYSTPSSAAANFQAGSPLDAGVLSQLGEFDGGSSLPSNLFRGEATHAVPIVVPPGIGEATPGVALVYRSRRGNSALGLGWSLELGAPEAIERSTRSGAPEYDASDEFELGGQRLVPTSEADRYATERYDHGRVDYVASGNYWRVLRPDGTRLYYGFEPSASNASRLESAQVMSPAPIASDCPTGAALAACSVQHEVIPAGVTFAWYLDRIEDRNGNAIHFRWAHLGDPGARYLDRIVYGNHVPNSGSFPDFGAATTLSAPLERTVIFGYEPRSDSFPSFRAGFRREIRHRLESITPKSGGVPVRHYRLGYVQSAASGRSLLESVEVRGADDDATTARTHVYTYTQGGTPGWSASPDPRWAIQPNLLDPYGRDNGARLVDLNADGFTDLFWGHSYYAGFPPGAYLGGPDGFSLSSDPSWTPPPIYTIADLNTFDNSPNALVFGDFNGDRRIDVMRRRLELDLFAAPPSTQLNPPCNDISKTIELEYGPISPDPDEPIPDPDGQAWLNTGSGWALSPKHQFPKVNISPTLTSVLNPPAPPANATYPFTQSCPKEAMPTGIHFTSRQGAPRYNHGYHNGVEIVDVDGDGFDDLAYFRRMDQTEWTSVKLTPSFSRYQLVRIVEDRAGVRLNDPVSGLAGGAFNHSHLAVTESIRNFSVDGRSIFRKAYDLPRWQLPQSLPGEIDVPAWQELAWCVASTGNSGGLLAYLVSSGHQRLVDVNGDGLPDVIARLDSGPNVYSEALLNDGYNWMLPEQPLDAAARPAEAFTEYSPGQISILFVNDQTFPNSECLESSPAEGEDRGWRIVDVNGDGGPDFIGGSASAVRLWDATAPSGSLWRPAGALGWALPPGVDFVPPVTPDPSAPEPRLADVNGDGMVDIVVQQGAHLNLASPPDLLDTVTAPLGAITDFDYLPSTDFEVPSSASNLESGQIQNPDPVWVLSRTTVDPGDHYGQPAIVNEFEYYGGAYDLRDRSLRGFHEVHVIGPAADGVRRVTETEFHVADALAGQPRRTSVLSEPAGGGAPTLLAEQTFDYAHMSSAIGAQPSIALSDGGTAQLGAGLTRDALLIWYGMVLGADTATLAYPIASTQRVFEGQATPYETVSERSFDVYGNVVHLTADDLEDPRSPEFEATIEYAILDDVIGGEPVLLANRPRHVVATGDPAGLPSETTTTRESQFFYDELPFGSVSRGNPSSSQQLWIDAWVESRTFYDDFGNPETLSAPRLVTSSAPLSNTVLGYDSATRSLVTTITRAAGTPLELVTTLQYARAPSAGCGVSRETRASPAIRIRA